MELEVYKKSDFYEDYIDSQKEYYERENADAYFAERLSEKDAEIVKLKAANKLLKEHIANGDVSRITWIDEVIELKQKLEDVQASMYCDVVDANMENRRLKHTLWLARVRTLMNFSVLAYFQILRANGKKSNMDFNEMAYRIDLARVKCRAKAEEYK